MLRLARAAASRAPAQSVWGALQQHRWCMMVHEDVTPNPDCMKFSPEGEEDDVPLMPDGVILDIVSPASAVEKSPLAERLFGVDGVRKVCLADSWLTVTKGEDLEWEDLSPQVIEAIKAWHKNGEAITSEEYMMNEDTEIDESFDSEVVQAVKELIKSRIRPWVQQDGGNIKYIGFEDGVVMLQMQGACQSCPSSVGTLKGGIEKMMMHWIPEVLEVRAVDDDFAEEYIIEMKSTRKMYKLVDGKLVPRSQDDDDVMNKGI
eukprot:TRINITY_DN11782_c0_g1_i1.p2 TRINITY_DN11782_c0_g1~~TRINITY_DN11782_c0_g1_i1.p2  ORF type:complete len:261 (+),score=112.51 TRINITY_DN11782_c0_g1_i1:107-889(+)